MDYILNKENEIYYECGWSSDNALFLSAGDRRYVITDGRYILEAKQNAKADVIEAKDLIKKARELILKHRVKRLHIDPTNYSKKDYESLKKIANLIDIPFFSFKKRIRKSKNELNLIKEAAKEGALAFREFSKMIEDGVDEFELSFRFKEVLTKRGKRELSFEPIVAINENAALPHARVSNKVLKKGDLLLLDAGIKHKRYCSDRTRTLFVGDNVSMSKTQKFTNKEIQKVYDIVKKAQEKAIKAVRVGVRAKDLDKIARDVIESAGFGRYFVHSLGHGVGLDIHEFPFINSKNETRIEEGMVFTIEPGIYIPNAFGVRIEDMVIIEDGKVKVLSEEV
ncbi:MAG: M24 family metallopeptidase [Nautiliaceae bacterium]